ncbi:MAG TPA: YbaN family protein [Burkholderiaceae bacterium]|nr:YbaN family protein [Burkholderiaceae bacterium]
MDKAFDDEAMAPRPLWRRLVWGAAGLLSLGLGILGIFLPLLPTTPFVLLAAFCFSRSSRRCEAWLLGHPRFGPMIHDWRAHRAIPWRAKQLAWLMMSFGSAMAAWRLPLAWCWVPAACCLAVGLWMWRLPTRERLPSH